MSKIWKMLWSLFRNKIDDTGFLYLGEKLGNIMSLLDANIEIQKYFLSHIN